MAFGALRGTLSGAANSITNPFSATGSVAVVRGDLIFAVLGEQTSVTVTAVTDNLGNTYTATQVGTDAGTSTGRAFYSRVTVPGTLTSVDAAATGSADNVAFFVAVIEGPVIASPLDANPTNITSDTTSPFTCPATGTLAQANEIVMSWAVATGSTVWAATSPNLLAGQLATQAVLHTVVGYQAVTATTTVSPEFTAGSNPTDAVLGTASFKRDDTPLGRMVAQTEWPNPQVPHNYQQALENRTWTQGFNPNLRVTAAATTYLPSQVSEQIVPWAADYSVQFRTFIDPLKRNLIGQDRFYGGPGQAPANRDWPNPRAPQRSIDLLTWAQGFQALLQPTIAYLPSGVTGWHNPQQSARAVGLHSFVNQFNIQLKNIAAALPPQRNYDWPNPRGARRSLTELTWIGQVVPYDNYVLRQPLITPQRARDVSAAIYSQARVWQNRLLTTLGTPAAPKPTALYDWPNPRAPAHAISLRSWARSLPVQFEPLYMPSVAEWANNPAGVPRANLYNWAQGFRALLDTVPAIPPPTNYNWPNPQAPTAAPRGSVDPLKLNLFGKDRFFGADGQPPANLDWPNPQAPRYASDLRTWTQGFRAQLDTIAAALPRNNYDWPNPPAAKDNIALRTFVSPLKRWLIGQDTFFRGPGFAPTYDWPNPRGATPSISLRTWADPLKLNLLGKDQFFGAPGQPPPNRDWPNPRGARSSIELRSWMLGFLMPLQPEPPAPEPSTTEWLITARRRGRR